MGHNDAIVSAVEEAGVTTYSTERDGERCCSTCATSSPRSPRRSEPLQVDLTGGLGDIELDMSELAAKAREEMAAEAAERRGGGSDGTIAALPSPPRGFTSAPPPAWDDLDVDPADLVVIVGGAELGPYGSSRTRFEMEVDNELSAAGVLELAWTTGPDQVGGRPEAGLVRHRIRRPGRRGASWSSATTTRSSSGSASASSSTTARSTPITRHRCWFRCSSTRTSPSWCRRRPTPARSCSSTRSTPVDRAGAGQQRLAGHPQGGHRDPGAAQDEAVADRRRADPHRVRPDGVRHQRRT